MSSTQAVTPAVPPAVVRASRLHQLLNCGKTKSFEVVKLPGFPRPVEFGGKTKAYVVSEVLAWLANDAPRAREAA